MAKKNNIRSIRFSDELAERIEHQVGGSFTEKFENLITRCVWELPQKEHEIGNLNLQINEKKKQFSKLSKRAESYARQLNAMDMQLQALSQSIAQCQELKWESEL